MKAGFLKKGKRGIIVMTAAAVAAFLIAISPTSSFAKVTDKPKVKKACSISVTEENVTKKPAVCVTYGRE